VSILPVPQLGTLPVLRERTRRVTSFGPSIQRLIDDMIDTMHQQHGVGIAANQIGSPLRIAIIEIPHNENEEEDRESLDHVHQFVLINPEIVRRVGEREVDEGCLSIPGLRGRLKRSIRVTAKALDREGKEYRIKAHGLLAQALEHETDHLNGTLYIDRVDKVEDLWPLVPAGEGEPSEKTGPDSQAIWRLRREAPPVVRRA